MLPYNLAKSRIDASEDSQPPLPICLNCGEFAFFAFFAFFTPSGWLDCLSVALAPIRILPDYMGRTCLAKWDRSVGRRPFLL